MDTDVEDSVQPGTADWSCKIFNLVFFFPCLFQEESLTSVSFFALGGRKERKALLCSIQDTLNKEQAEKMPGDVPSRWPGQGQG